VGCVTEALSLQVTDQVQPQMDTGLEGGKFKVAAVLIQSQAVSTSFSVS
jgi:hypothetical protein